MVFSPKDGYIDMPMSVPCGQCVGCRLERSRQWAIRCVHEASLHDRNCFITLTYNNDNLPEGGTLVLDHFQRFMKRLRKKYYGKGIRFFHAGEYGSRLGRPHYHAILFGHDFDDKYAWRKSPSGSMLYRSNDLEKLWQYGYSSIGDVTFESAAYVARYILKKVTGDNADDHYRGRKPEYTTMSRRPGIGRGWFERFNGDVFPRDELILNGKKLKPPKYYDGLYELMDPDSYNEIKLKRKLDAKKQKENNTYDRLRVREEIQNSKLKRLKRTLSNEGI